MAEQLDPQRAPYAAPPAIGSGIAVRIARLLLRRGARGLILAGQIIRPRLGWVLLTLFLVGLIGIETIALAAPLFITKISDNRSPAIPTSAAVEAFLKGQARYDIDMIWDSFSPRLQASLIDQGTSKEDLAAQMQTIRASGQTFTRFSYVGGVDLQDSQRMYVYVVHISSSQANQSDTLTFIFTVDQQGKIVDVRQ